MKKTILLSLILLTSIIQNISAQTTGVPSILNSYLKIKDALVNSNAKSAQTSSNELIQNINAVTISGLKLKEKTVFEKQKENLIKSAKKIALTDNIEKQRTAFAELSITTWLLIKIAESVNQSVYYEYCPMKKSYWLSTEKEIKNPYYGSSMLTCGNVSEKK